MPTHKAVQVPEANAALTVVDVDTPSPSAGHVRIEVAACGVCGTDREFHAGHFPGLQWPLTLGHEIAGSIAEVGDGVEDFAAGDRVAVGWFGGNCNRCIPCRQGHFMQCVRMEVPSWHYPGGYAESVTVPATALARIPDGLSFVEAAPMGCAGVTTFNGLRQTRAKAGDVVAILGVGGLGHLGVQFARAMGFETVAIARGTGKAEEATKLGGAAVVLATANNAEAMAATVGGLRPAGELVAVGVTPENLPISPLDLINSGLSVSGHPSGTSRDVEETLHFAVLSGVRAMVEPRPLAEAAEAFQAMDSGKARYRMVLTV